MFELLQKTLYEIKSTLLNDELVRKLIYNDSNNCLNMEPPTKDVVKQYITLHPIYQFENTKCYEQQGMINIFVYGNTANDGYVTTSGALQINIVFNIDKWELVDGKIRPLELADRIVRLVDNKKFSISNQLKYASTQPLVLSKQLVGYALLFNYVDGNSELNNF